MGSEAKITHCEVGTWVLSLMLRNAIYSGKHRNATTAACISDYEAEMKLDVERKGRLTLQFQM